MQFSIINQLSKILHACPALPELITRRSGTLPGQDKICQHVFVFVQQALILMRTAPHLPDHQPGKQQVKPHDKGRGTDQLLIKIYQHYQ